jgi:hypothetical protein
MREVTFVLKEKYKSTLGLLAFLQATLHKIREQSRNKETV